MIKIIFFDVGGVLLTIYDKSERRKMRAKVLGLNSRVIDAHFRSRYMNLLQAGKITEFKFWSVLCKKNSKPCLRSKIKDLFTIKKFHIKKQMLELVRRLKNQGYSVGIISNTLSEKDRQRQKLYNEFKPRILSYQVGAVKPQKKIFEIAMRVARVRPKEMIFIDDRLDFVKKVRTYGIKSIHFTTIPNLLRSLRKSVIIH